jgi:hypothetical protein
MIRKTAKKILRTLGLAAVPPAGAQKYPPGHFYSPLPGAPDIARRENQWTEPSDMDLNTEGQRRLLGELARFYPEMPFGDTPPAGGRYSFAQDYYCHSDAIYLYSLLRHLRPRRLIEVGSGHSSAAALDTSERFLGGAVEFTFIEPFAQRLKSVLKPEETARCRLIEKPVQEVPLAVYDALEANDILLIDSSHVSKAGSDVNHLFFHVLPRLKPGVVVHVHDIFFPFEYPEGWLREGRAWNEAYLLRAFLQNNSAYEVLLFGDYAGRHFREFLAEQMPLCLKNTGGAFWMRKRVAMSK